MPSKQKQMLFGVPLVALQFFGTPCQAAPPVYDRDTRSYNLAHGWVVFTDKCMRCHESGRKGAPVHDEVQ